MTQASIYVAELCRLYVLVVFLVSAASKAMTIVAFEETIGELVRLPGWLTRSIAYGVVGVEGGAVLLLMSSTDGRHAGMIVALLLLIVFTLVIAIALFQQKEVSCNCFGSSKKEISIFDLVRNAFVIAACAFFLVYPPLGFTLPFTALVLLLGVALILFVLSTNLDEVAVLAR